MPLAAISTSERGIGTHSEESTSGDMQQSTAKQQRRLGEEGALSLNGVLHQIVEVEWRDERRWCDGVVGRDRRVSRLERRGIDM